MIPPGVEPGTYALEGRCSIQLSYRTVFPLLRCKYTTKFYTSNSLSKKNIINTTQKKAHPTHTPYFLTIIIIFLYKKKYFFLKNPHFKLTRISECTLKISKLLLLFNIVFPFQETLNKIIFYNNVFTTITPPTARLINQLDKHKSLHTHKIVNCLYNSSVYISD